MLDKIILFLLKTGLKGGRLLSSLEGGYELENLERCVAAHVRALVDAE